MKIYIAAPWVWRFEAIQQAQAFEAAGHRITSRWFTHEGDPIDNTGGKLDPKEVRRQALEDLDDVRESDLVVVLNFERSEGKAVETGFALAHKIPVIQVGPRGSIFACLCKEVATVEEALEAIRGGACSRT